MCEDYNIHKKIKRVKGVEFTLAEAIQFERDMISSPTGSSLNYQWISVNTNMPINFSY
jgi:hypothetical protein